MAWAADRLVGDLTDQFAACFPQRISVPRTVGREAEFPLVDPEGRAGDASRVWPLLVEEGYDPIVDRVPGGPPGALIGVRGRGWECVVEVGRCTMEVVVGPRPSLWALREDFETAVGVLLPAVDRAGYRLLGYGIQPRTPSGPGLLAPKRRYPVMTRVTGGRWLRWCVTASDQVHVAVSQRELVPMLNVMNGLAGVLIAATANSSVYRGRAGRFASGREGLMEDITGERFRHGAVPRPFGDLEDWIRFVLDFRCLFLPDGRGGYREPGRPMMELLDRYPDLDSFLFHDHYLWPSARPRARLGTLEVRPACQQPPVDSWAATALIVGLTEAHQQAGAVVEDRLGADPWPALLRFRRAAVRDGVRSAEPLGGFLEELFEVAERGLQRRGQGEETLLAPVRDRLEHRWGPADAARKLASERGASALVEALRLT
jgi:gamma-glutamylcysteine synthetase